MKNIVYICNYMMDDIIKVRKNKKIYSQAANNKINGIVSCLEKNNCKVDIVSNGLVNNKTFKYYDSFKSNVNNKVIYAGIIDIPIINIVSSIISILNIISLLNKKQKIDYIIFYNYRPETALSAYILKKLYKIPIVVDYEDGYFNLNEISCFKKKIINYIEKLVSNNIDGAILVTSMLKDRVNCKSYVLRGLTNEYIFKKSNKKEANKVPTIMYSGGLERVRGIEVLLKSLEYTDSKFQLIISGKGEYEDKIRKCNDKRLKFLGYIDYEIVVKEMINSDILINCQLENDSFGNASFPSKLFEYASTNNLIISSEVSDVKEFMGNTIDLYDSDNPVDLAKTIDKLLAKLEDINFIKEKKQKVYDFAIKNTPRYIGEELVNNIFKDKI